MPPAIDLDRLMSSAQRALAERWAMDVTLYLQRPIRSDWGRLTLLLCNVDAGAGKPTTAVVKAAVQSNAAIFNEWAALEWLNGLGTISPLIPAIYAGNVEDQLVVLEELGAGPSLHRMLQTRPTWAIDALVDSQHLLGSIHSATRGRAAELRARRAILPGGPPPPAVATSVEAMRAELEEWGRSLSPKEVGELAAVAAALEIAEPLPSSTATPSTKMTAASATTS
jgi:hypothetical protein